MGQCEQSNEFIIKIDFEKGSANPARVFNAMAELINAFHEMDKTLVMSFGVNVEPSIILQDIEPGSIKTRLCSILKSIDDDALKELDWKKAIGSFVVKGKHKIIKSVEGKTEITSIEEVKQIEDQILRLAQQTDVQNIPLYSSVPTQKLLESISLLSQAMYNLSEKDKVSIISEEGEVYLNRGLKLSSQSIEELLTKQTVSQQSEMILLIKKPDYLGQSMWDVQYNGKTIQAKIIDLEWLGEFQRREIHLLPGDSLRAMVHAEVKLGEKNIVIAEHYIILKIYEVINAVSSEQEKLI